MHHFIRISTWVTICLLFAQCRSVHNEPQYPVDVLPQAPQYSDPSQWYITSRDAVADIFYITSTETGDYKLKDGTPCHYADTRNDSTRGPILGEMQGVDALISGSLNYYSPYYRQCSLQTFASDSLVQARLPIATDDVRRSFRYYLDHLNGGRPFVLAGFSQGAMIMLQLMKEMDKATRGRMIAAYAIGVTITSDDIKHNGNIVPAQGADDTGVTICYNSVRDPSCPSRHAHHRAVATHPT